jgi:hypothetical protein
VDTTDIAPQLSGSPAHLQNLPFEFCLVPAQKRSKIRLERVSEIARHLYTSGFSSGRSENRPLGLRKILTFASSRMHNHLNTSR